MRYRLHDSVRADQARGIENGPGPTAISFQKSSCLDVNPALACLFHIAIGVLVGNRHGQLVVQLRGGLVNRSGVGELRKNHELDVEKRLVANDCPVDHFQQVPYPPGDLVAMAWAGQIGLAGGGVIAFHA